MDNLLNIAGINQVEYKGFKVYYKVDETKECFVWDMQRYQYKIYVYNKENKKKISFDYHGSNNDWQNDKELLTKKELLFCFYCFLSDAESGKMKLENFLSELGYLNKENISCGINAHKECKKSLRKVKTLEIEEDKRYELLDDEKLNQ